MNYHKSLENDKKALAKLENIGLISGYLNNPSYIGDIFSGNGIVSINLKKINNLGKINGESILKTSNEYYEKTYNGLYHDGLGNGVLTANFYNFNLNNSGMILGKSFAGNFFPDDPNNLQNFFGYYDGTGNGIYLHDRYTNGKRGTEEGKHNLTAGVNYTRILSGADEDNLTGNFGGNSFDILVPQKTKNNVSVGLKYDIELENRVMLGAKASYDVPFKVSQDNHTHKNEGSWRVGVGIGYRFNTLSDLNPMNIISSSKKDSSITLRTKSYFEFDKAELSNNSKKVIEKFSEEINRDNLKGKIKIEGYTDNIGKSSYNEKLSLERANRVAEELKKQVKSRDTEYEILGKGASNPIGDNGTEKGRAKNRRVEIEFQEK